MTGELVTIGNEPQKPHCVLGVISGIYNVFFSDIFEFMYIVLQGKCFELTNLDSTATPADGKKLIHEVDLELKRGSLIHEIGVTNKYTFGFLIVMKMFM